MALKDFLLKYVLIITLAIAAAMVVNFLNGRQYKNNNKTQEQPEANCDIQAPKQITPKTIRGTIKPNSSTTDTVISDKVHAYMPDVYTLPYSGSGKLESVANSSSTITITNNGANLRAIITPTTQIFRNAERALLTDVQETDKITVIGRKKSADSDEFIADSIYASVSLENPAPADSAVKP